MHLTDEDKKWIVTQLSALATRAELERVETGLLATLATRAELADLAKQLDLATLASKVELERVETALLTEFHKWASPNDQKLRSHREALRALDLEIEAIAGRVTKLEAAQESRH